MILVDTAVWIDHLRQSNDELKELLGLEKVLVHPFVIGELALGTLRYRESFLRLLARLPQAVVAGADEILQFIERHALFGRGIGYVDVHLLASARLTADARLWTRDKRLADIARELRIGWPAG